MKENLLRIKRLLERKCVAINYEGIYGVESYLEVVKSIDNEGAFNYIQEYINSAKEYYTRNGIEYDEIQLYPMFSLYFDSKYDDRYSDTIENKVKPIQDILRIFINAVGYEKNRKRGTVDPDEVIENNNKEFVITFDDFKSMIEENGLTIGYSTFESILNDYRKETPAVCKISKEKNKINKLENN